MSQLRHVVIVNDRAVPIGGASAVALQSAIALVSTGIRVTVFAGGRDIWPELLGSGVDVITVEQDEIASRSLGAAVSGFWNLSAHRELRRLLKQHDPKSTIVHVHSWSKALSPSVFSAVATSGFHQLLTLHDYGFVCPNAALHDFPSGTACTRDPMSRACVTRNCDARHATHKLWRIGRQLSLQWLARAHEHVDAAICVTDYARDVYKKHVPSTLPLITVKNPIAVDDLGPADPATKRDVLYIGRLSREKGAVVFAEAASALRLPAVFVGEGEMARDVLERYPEASITGWLARADVTNRIRNARAIVVPSLWRETQGMVVFEALANGVPPIVSSGTAPASFVSDGKTGLIFDNGDSASLANALRRLEDQRVVRELGLAGYIDYWASPATMSAHVASLRAVYEAVMAKPLRRRSSAVTATP